MAQLLLVILRLATLHFFGSKVSAATIESVQLVGDSNNYINILSKKPYTLRCKYRAGYDDPVGSVNWYKADQMVYNWNEGETIATAFDTLSGKVAVTGTKALKDLNFNRHITLDISGNYTCEVVSKKEKTRSKPYNLVVLDISSDDFLSNVTLMSETPNQALDETPDDRSNCTLLWDFKTPAIFPRPNVTCGYYSYLHDDVTNPLPSGLTMHLLNNGSWQAGFEHIHVQVSAIPREKRLGCSVQVPNTNFKKVVKFEDNFAIDHLIDSEGCPSMFLDPSYRLKFTLDGGDFNCRGDLVSDSDAQPLHVKFGCSLRDFALFSNGTVMAAWSTEMICDPMDLMWRKVEDGVMSKVVIDIEEEVPICLPSLSSGSRCGRSFGTLLSLILASFVGHYLN